MARGKRHRADRQARIELVHLPEQDPRYHLPYTPAIKVRGGALVFVAGVTAAPVYHSHPHVPEEFAGIPADPAAQTEKAVENLRRVLRAAGGELRDVVQLFRFITDLDRNQDAVNAVMSRALGAHRPTSTTVEVVRLATDARLVVELAAVAVVPEGRRIPKRRRAARARKAVHRHVGRLEPRGVRERGRVRPRAPAGSPAPAPPARTTAVTPPRRFRPRGPRPTWPESRRGSGGRSESTSRAPAPTS